MSARAWSWLGALLLVTSGCGSREAGIGVTVTLAAKGPLPAEVRLARLSVSQVQALSCSEVMAALSPVSTAWAHEGATPTPLLSTTPVDVDLLNGAPVTLTTLSPPPGLLCGVEVTLSPVAGPERWSDATFFFDVATASANRSYFTRTAKRQRVLFLPTELSSSKRRHQLALELDPSPLASLDPAVNDAHRELLDTLLASLTASMFQP